MDNLLASREISSFPLSIGTGLAFESLFIPTADRIDPNREIPNKVILKNYQSCYINIATLYRNMISSIDKDTFLNSGYKEFIQEILQEMSVIHSLFKNEGSGTCIPYFYIMSYKSLKSTSNVSKLRVDKTDFQKAVRFKWKKIKEELIKNQSILNLDTGFKKTLDRSIILTHVPYDLIHHDSFSKLDLLESHTGKLKSKFEWGSKYFKFGDYDFDTLPFNRKLLLVFGDNVLIQPTDIKLRRLVIDVAKNRKWTPATTLAKINMDFSLDIKEPLVLSVLLSL
jgi:hypothetical protein